MKKAKPASVLRQLSECLRALDEIGAPLAAAHLEAAITQLCIQFDLKRYGSDPD